MRLIKESHNTYKDTTLFLSSFGTYKKPITEIILDMPGLTEDQKNKSIQAFKDLEKSPSKKKLEPQF